MTKNNSEKWIITIDPKKALLITRITSFILITFATLASTVLMIKSRQDLFNLKAPLWIDSILWLFASLASFSFYETFFTGNNKKMQDFWVRIALACLFLSIMASGIQFTFMKFNTQSLFSKEIFFMVITPFMIVTAGISFLYFMKPVYKKRE